MNFNNELKALESKLTIPYPEREDFLREVESNLLDHYRTLLEKGLCHEEARRQAIWEMRLETEEIAELGQIHKSITARVIDILPPDISHIIQNYCGVVPLVIFIFYSMEEFSMLNFLREGGLLGVIVILTLGGMGLALNLKHLFRWFALRDHSNDSVSNFSNAPLYLAAAAFFAGVINTSVGYRLVFEKWSEGIISDSVAKAGLSEPLSSIIVAATIAGLIILLHGWLASWRNSILRLQS